jgi:DNA end-binding protein Ku
MGVRSISTAVLTFGLVSIPIKVYVACSSETVSFNQLTKAGNRIKQKNFDAVTGEEVETKDLDKGYEVAKDTYVRFTKEELKALESESAKTMDIREFVDAASVDPIQVEKSYYLGPDKGGDKGYVLIAETMKALGKVAVAQWNSRGKDRLVIIRPHASKTGLVLQEMFYEDEVRSFDEVAPAKIAMHDAERDMAAKLIQSLDTGAYVPNKYKDGHIARVKDAVERKVKGLGPVEPGTAPVAPVLDLLAALQASLAASAKK